MKKLLIALFFCSLLFACTQKKAVKQVPLDHLSMNQLDSLWKKYPDSVPVLSTYGSKLLDDLQGDSALPILAKAHRLRPQDIDLEALYASALVNRIHKTTSEVETAINILKEIIKKQPGNKRALLDLATAYSFFQDYENTFKYANDALRIDKKYRDAYMVKGRAYYKMGNMKLAKSSFETAVQQDTKFFLGYLQLGWLYTETEDYKHALEYFTTARTLDEKSTDAIYGVAYCQQMLNEYGEAMQSYRDLLKVDSVYYLAYFNQAYIKEYGEKEIDSAVFYYKKALELQPEFVKGWHQLGMCYLEKGHKETALVAFQKALEFNPDYEPTRYILKRDYKNFKFTGKEINH